VDRSAAVARATSKKRASAPGTYSGWYLVGRRGLVIRRLSHVAVYVLDQDRALKFYTDVLGFEVRTDITVDGFRWLTVGPKEQPDLAVLLAVPAPPMFAPEDARTMQALVAKGAFHGGVLETDNCRATYEHLKARGVTFLQEPAERPYGVEAVFRDDSGNWFSLTERHPHAD
jgi:catechol 2,3-dioxygenase-like lactoylglutathione lyase family enzyme